MRDVCLCSKLLLAFLKELQPGKCWNFVWFLVWRFDNYILANNIQYSLLNWKLKLTTKMHAHLAAKDSDHQVSIFAYTKCEPFHPKPKLPTTYYIMVYTCTRTTAFLTRSWLPLVICSILDHCHYTCMYTCTCIPQGNDSHADTKLKKACEWFDNWSTYIRTLYIIIFIALYTQAWKHSTRLDQHAP